MDRIAAFGIGSTNFRYALGTPTGEFITDVLTEPTRPRDLPSQLCEAIEALERRSPDPVDAVSICCAGLIDADRGVIEEIDTPEGEAVEDLRVCERIGAEFGLPTYLENDCNASVVGEYMFGAGQPFDSIAHLTIGTGIGAGVIENGRVLRGEHGHAAEVGLIPIAADGDLDSFGVPGAWEAYCSGRGIPRFIKSLLAEETRSTELTAYDPLRTRHLFEAVENGDRVAKDYLDRIARYDAAGLGALANTCNPGIISLGGGVVLYNEDTLVPLIEDHLEDFLFVEPPEIQVTPLGEDIGLYGALGRVEFDGSATKAAQALQTVETTALEEDR